MRSKPYPVLASAFILSAVALTAEAAPPRPYVEGEVIVKFKKALGPSEMGVAARAGQSRATIARPLVDPVTGTGRVALSRFSRTTSVDAMMARLRAQPDVEFVEPNYVVSLGEPKIGSLGAPRTTLTRRAGVDAGGHLLTRGVAATDMMSHTSTYPNDPGSLDPMKGWGWLWVNADIVWPDPRAGEVAVLDTGVDARHPELLGLVMNGYDYINDDFVADDDNGHGTHVAGIISARANNKTGVAGVARARIYAIKVLGADGSGTYFDIAAGIRRAADRPSVRVINLSLGGPAFSQTLMDAVEYAVVTKGKLLVAAAGNESLPGQPPSSDPFYPAAFSVDFPERVLAVAASGLHVTGSQDGEDHFLEYCRADYSSYGDYVNITAPGTDIYSTQPWRKDFYNHRYFGADSDLTGYEFYSGSSMAAPHVSAIAARVFGNNLKFTNVQVAHRLLTQGYSSEIGTPIDVDGDGIDEVTECWESGFTPPTPVGVTPLLADVNAATALGRGRITGRLMDAATGLGLKGATARLFSGTRPAGFGGLIETEGTSFFDVINVPWNDQTGSGPLSTPYRLRVSKPGYTLGVVEDYVAGDAQKPGISLGFFDVEHPIRQVSIPPVASGLVFVTDWGTWDSGTYAATTELDQYLFRPNNLADPFDLGCTTGWDDLLGGCDPDITSIGSLYASPWARWMRDGGPTDGLGTETTWIRRLLKTTAGNEYRLFLTDYSDGTGFDLPDAKPVVRLWKRGVVQATIRFETAAIDPACVSAGGSTPCDWWNVGSLTGTGVFSTINTLGDAGAWPFGSGIGVSVASPGPRTRTHTTHASVSAAGVGASAVSAGVQP